MPSPDPLEPLTSDRPLPAPQARGLTTAQWSALGIVLSFILGIVALALAYGFGGSLLRVEGQGSVEGLVGRIAAGPFAPAGVMLVFSVLALAGVPQFILIAATVAVFGPWLGASFSWLATMGSAAFGFVLGRWFAQRMMHRYGGARLNQAGALIARHGIVSSALVRNVPSVPFIVLNVAAGATPMSTAKFLIGTGLGIVPKIAFIALLGSGMAGILESRKPEDFFLIIAVVAIWIAFGVVLKRYLPRTNGGPAGAGGEGKPDLTKGARSTEGSDRGA